MKGTVKFDAVSKRYRLGVLGSLRSTVSALLSRDNDIHNWGRVLWALRDVTFQVSPGESLGLIGSNGSGKTTTLKLLSNITRPSNGKIEVKGRIASLIELGAGFHPELTGRENIYLNGAILGLKRREIKRKLDDIIAFSGLERFIHTPIKRYSSGMYVRLGFAVAAHVEADVLLVDEVLAVGDSEFRRKCIERMEELRRSGTTLIFVSHNMYQVRRLCNRSLLLVNGEPHFLGDTEAAISAYEKIIRSSVEDNKEDKNSTESLGTADAPGTVVISNIVLLDHAGTPITQLKYNQNLTIQITYQARQSITNPIFKVRLIRSDDTTCIMTASAYQPNLAWTLAEQGTVNVQFQPAQLVTGKYRAEVDIVDSTESMLITSSQSGWFYVNAPAFGHEIERGVFIPNLQWSHKPKESSKSYPCERVPANADHIKEATV